jgi:hypothetical protein
METMLPGRRGGRYARLGFRRGGGGGARLGGGGWGGALTGLRRGLGRDPMLPLSGRCGGRCARRRFPGCPRLPPIVLLRGRRSCRRRRRTHRGCRRMMVVVMPGRGGGGRCAGAGRGRGVWLRGCQCDRHATRGKERNEGSFHRFLADGLWFAMFSAEIKLSKS